MNFRRLDLGLSQDVTEYGIKPMHGNVWAFIMTPCGCIRSRKHSLLVIVAKKKTITSQVFKYMK